MHADGGQARPAVHMSAKAKKKKKKKAKKNVGTSFWPSKTICIINLDRRSHLTVALS